MRKSIIGSVVFLSILTGMAYADSVPRELGGFALGDSLKAYESRLKPDTLFPLRHSKYINEIETAPLEGFANGLVWAGNCAEPGRIVRIRLKYQDSSKKFYEEILKRFKQRFGDPSEWRGDPFHIVLAWKWSFTDQKGNRISLVLQHNTRDEEESIGNTVKLTMWNLIEEERNCYRKKTVVEPKEKKPAEKTKPDWDLLIPQ